MRLFFVLVVLLFTSGNVLADSTLIYENPAGQPVLVHYLSNGHLRSEDRSENIIVIYSADANSQTILYPDEKKFAVLSPEALQQQVSGPIAAFREQMENMPEAQREMMKNMMGALLARFTPKVEKGATTTVGGYECQQVTITIGDKISSQMCLADPEAIGVPDAGYEMLKQMMDDMQKMVNSIMPGLSVDLSALTELKGVPVSITEDGVTKVLATVSHDDIDPSLFTVPEGYTRKDFSAQ